MNLQYIITEYWHMIVLDSVISWTHYCKIEKTSSFVFLCSAYIQKFNVYNSLILDNWLKCKIQSLVKKHCFFFIFKAILFSVFLFPFFLLNFTRLLSIFNSMFSMNVLFPHLNRLIERPCKLTFTPWKEHWQNFF